MPRKKAFCEPVGYRVSILMGRLEVEYLTHHHTTPAGLISYYTTADGRMYNTRYGYIRSTPIKALRVFQLAVRYERFSFEHEMNLIAQAEKLIEAYKESDRLKNEIQQTGTLSTKTKVSANKINHLERYEQWVRLLKSGN